jgi:hypothetical protein
LPTFFAAAKKVGAAPHRGNANRPLTKQGKAKKPKAATKNPTRQPSHYMDQPLTYWRFPKNRPTIRTNTQSATKQRQKKSPRSAKATAKKPETKPTMPKAKRQHHDAQSIAQSIARTARTASTQGPLSGPAL